MTTDPLNYGACGKSAPAGRSRRRYCRHWMDMAKYGMVQSPSEAQRAKYEMVQSPSEADGESLKGGCERVDKGGC